MKPSNSGLVRKEYWAWMGMRSRCNSPLNKDFYKYGGRGIKVCGRWDEFPNFIADMGPRPEGSYSIDRIDNDGNYEPGNCRWATILEQNRNKRNINNMTHLGETMCLYAWAKRLGISPATITSRLSRGESAERALRPARRYTNTMLTYLGETLTVAEWAARLGLVYSTILNRLWRGEDTMLALRPPDRIRRKSK